MTHATTPMAEPDLAALVELRDWLRGRERKCHDNATSLAEHGDDDYLSWADAAKDYARRAGAVESLLSSHAQMKAGVPEGWKLVPVEASAEMLWAADSARTLEGKYRLMLAAAPNPPAKEPEKESE